MIELAVVKFNPTFVLHTSQISCDVPFVTQRIVAFSQNPSSRNRRQVSGCDSSREIVTDVPAGISASVYIFIFGI